MVLTHMHGEHLKVQNRSSGARGFPADEMKNKKNEFEREYNITDKIQR